MNCEQRVAFLRFVCLKRYPEIAKSLVIKYLSDNDSVGDYEYASAAPINISREGSKRQIDGSVKVADTCYARWIAIQSTTTEDQIKRRCKQIRKLGETASRVPNIYFLDSLRPRMRWMNAPGNALDAFGDHTSERQGQNVLIGFDMIFGDDDIGAVFAPVGIATNIRLDKRFSLDDINSAFLQGLVSRSLLIEHFTQNDWHEGMRKMFQGLNSLSVLSSIYKNLHGATVSLQIADHKITEWQWSQDLDSTVFLSLNSSYGFDERLRFACILACESGSVDLPPKSLRNVMAISSGNSLYVAKALLKDPWKEPGQEFAEQYADLASVERIVGNVGRPGIIMMIAPDQPRVRKLENDAWHVISHTGFNGTPDDAFQQLTLHISISDWQQAVDTSALGIRDTEVCFVNGFVAVHDILDTKSVKMESESDVEIFSPPRVAPVNSAIAQGEHKRRVYDIHIW